MSERTSSRWQSIAETLALVVVAVAVASMAITRSAPTANSAAAPKTKPRPEAPWPAEPISLAGAEIEGHPTARVALVVYSDFQCPYCGKFARETLPAIQAKYVRSGKLLLAFRQYPLPNHEFAQKAAEAAECAGKQGRFWAFHDQLFANQRALDLASLSTYAVKVGLEPKQFATCLDGQTVASVKADNAGGDQVGVSGTPSFVAGPILPDGRIKVTERFSGALPLSEFQRVLDRLGATSDGTASGGQK